MSDPLYLRYRHLLDRDAPGARQVMSPADIPLDATRARLKRDKKSHKGIGDRKALRTLIADAVDQSYLDEIAQLDRLEHLELAWPTTARDLAPLAKLRQLRVLKIDSPRAVTDFTPILDLPVLEVLLIENAKHLTSLDWLTPLRDRLTVLGIEGSMWTRQRIPTLAPLVGFAVEALFLTGTTIADRSLAPLHSMPNLNFLGTARNAPRAQFQALHAAKPDLVCDWFRADMWPPEER